MSSQKKIRLLSLACTAGLFSLAPSARGVITYGGYNPVSTDPAPGNVDLYEGQFYGGYTGTPISSNILATATHVTPGPSTTFFTFNNGGATTTTYNIQQVATLDDLALWEIAPGQPGSFSNTASIYTGSSEVGSTIVDVGRGFSAGGPNYQPGTTTQDGWVWGGGQGPFSWGNNTVSAIATGAQFGLSGPQGGPYLEFDYKNLPSNPNEAIITPFDSGGGAFINVGGTYELAGTNTFVTQVADSSGTPVQSVLWDTYGYYDDNAQGQLQQITTHNLPESSYATRISTKQNLVGVVTGTITAAQAASFPILDDSQLGIYSTMTTGAITATPGAPGGQLIIGNTSFSATLHIAKNSGLSRFSDLTIGYNSQLDINNNHAIINYTAGSDPIASIAAWIKSGYANGAWNGAGIMSTAAQTNSGSYGIGYADAADPGNPAGLLSGQIEIKYTLLGDANLDGSVNGSDFAILASNFNKAVSGWDAGDFNYDGSANGADFAALAANFNKGASQSSIADLQALDSFAVTNDLNNVPEPVALSLLIPASAFLFQRRRWC